MVVPTYLAQPTSDQEIKPLQETCTQCGHVFLTFWGGFFFLEFVLSTSKDLRISKAWYIRHTHRCHGAMPASTEKKKGKKSDSLKWAISGEASCGGWVGTLWETDHGCIPKAISEGRVVSSSAMSPHVNPAQRYRYLPDIDSVLQEV